MIIEEHDFRMTQALGPFWDLELLYTVKPKGKPAREEFKEAGYGLPLESCIKRVINHRMALKKEVYTLKEFLENYKIELTKITNLLKDETEKV